MYLVKAEKLSLWVSSIEGMDQGMTVTEYQDGPKIIGSYSQRRGIEFTSLQY